MPLAYLSDEFLLGTALTPHPDTFNWDRLFTASLDHALWFHRPVRADEWLVFELRGAGVADTRGLAFARVFAGGVMSRRWRRRHSVVDRAGR